MGRRLQILLVVVNVGFWVAILGWSWFGDRPPPPDVLDDPAFATAAEPICRSAMDRIESFGLPTAVENALERAVLVDQDNEVLRAMVGDLRDLPRPSGDEGEWVTQWLADWDTHIEDRQRWSDDLRQGDDHAFIETARNGEQLSNQIDQFAVRNAMESCQTSGDV